ncbi:hypothetical protein Pyn_38339 [Prunus yedoensis var. nudiflora]|uniref:Uncharacterized protein n=1 Tax=Prunus yedoensis var. nudiflora TaxID=2094558 RepID=A0A314ZY75_PRUYE|nr:hypothetical protein Pyn_38339 [Prunus yedoensis var. nudiflora]
MDICCGIAIGTLETMNWREAPPSPWTSQNDVGDVSGVKVSTVEGQIFALKYLILSQPSVSLQNDPIESCSS